MYPPRRKLFQKVQNRAPLRWSIVVVILFSRVKLNALTSSSHFQESKNAVPRTLKVVRTLVIVQEHSWNPHVVARRKGKVVPLHVAKKLVKASYFHHLAAQTAVHETLFQQIMIEIIEGAPTL
jgi:hypothetical protein